MISLCKSVAKKDFMKYAAYKDGYLIDSGLENMLKSLLYKEDEDADDADEYDEE
jgi:hypothetical protein